MLWWEKNRECEEELKRGNTYDSFYFDNAMHSFSTSSTAVFSTAVSRSEITHEEERPRALLSLSLVVSLEEVDSNDGPS